MNNQPIRLRKSQNSGSRRKCLRCSNPHFARGLCQSHYQKAMYMVRQGVETWESLITSSSAMPKMIAIPLPPKKDRIRQAIVELLNEGVYPSGVAISSKLRRRSSNLRNDECKMRDEIFRELNIEKKCTLTYPACSKAHVDA